MDTQTQAFIGIDPGRTGAICLNVPEANHIEFLPTDLAPDQLISILRGWGNMYNIPLIMMEQVSSIPGASAMSNFRFGYNVGCIQTVAVATSLGLDLVRPKAWQKEVGVPGKVKSGPELKKAVAEIAKRLYPNAELHGPKGGLLDGRSDALMIAHYARIKYGTT